ncbi:GNAT family N-acetyltransferase [Aquimarina sp. 2201CG5-10]|uniref:GNAT family N-acetyltransferase n=1 Tax=Aquimarina callyspongiae TaxID=3098150 RepID=UPI002AB4978E|nr:GNAT family N-acetyltransferase [Aquimarina sp. 2201CG5-10]MDY8138560.1 GNAT family N-acetyltransferase [Aquimarina sp. 2201CG5-10]
MRVYTIKKYQKDHYSLWNSFVADAKNGTFLFHRDFIEYHKDRFDDFSLLIYDGQRLIALLPANKSNTDIYSHQGLTYGGLILRKSIGGEKIRHILQTLTDYIKSEGNHRLFIKYQPSFYNQRPSNELSFFLTDSGGEMYRRDLNLAIDYRLPLQIHKSKLKHFDKKRDLGFVIEEVEDCSEFWEQVLIPRLQQKHKTTPVHSISEIMLLKNRFPENIKQFVIRFQGKIQAGITIFKTTTVVKSQYGAVTMDGEKNRALDFLFISLIKKYKEEGYLFFDMGTVTENNFGLLKQKEELGCEIYTQDFYRLSL